MVGYADSIRIDATPEQTNARVASLKLRCLKLLDTLEASGDFSPIDGQVNYSIMYDALDANFVIVLMDFYLREATAPCLDA